MSKTMSNTVNVPPFNMICYQIISRLGDISVILDIHLFFVHPNDCICIQALWTNIKLTGLNYTYDVTLSAFVLELKV